MSSFYLCPIPKLQFCDQNGLPYAGGQVFTYAAGTSTPQATYTDGTGDTPNANPVVLDAAGRAEIWLGSGAYKIVLEDVNNNVIWTIDDVEGEVASGGGLGGPQTFSIADNQSSYQNITGMSVAETTNQCVVLEYTILRSNGGSPTPTRRREHGYLYCTYDATNGWVLNRSTQGTDSLNMGSTSLAITAGGQIQYKTDSMGGGASYNGKITWQVQSAFATEGF